jgi:putative restriction endonuclease
MQTQLLQNYIYLFQNLHVNRQKGKRAPHKAVMLISVMELIGEGMINSNQIEFSEELEGRFKRNWQRYVSESDVFKPNAGTPFWHLRSEPYWILVLFIGGEDTLESLKRTNPYSHGTIRQHIKFAVMDKQLFELIHHPPIRTELTRLLLYTYIETR